MESNDGQSAHTPEAAELIELVQGIRHDPKLNEDGFQQIKEIVGSCLFNTGG